MLHSEYAGQNCSIARALEVVGERWTLLIVRELMKRPSRFAELESELGISKNILSSRLEKLTARGVIKKQPYTTARDWNEYALTRKGRDLFYVISALMAWGDAYEAPDGPPAVFLHSCGEPAGHRLACQSCGEEVTPNNVRGAPGPGFRPSARNHREVA